MSIKSEEDITRIVKADPWMMDVLRAAEELDLPNWWIGAGFLRNKVWDAIEGNNLTVSHDVDLVYFDPEDRAPETDWLYDEKLKTTHSFADWEVRNQARMHYVNGFPPYTSTEEGISHWVETATCVAVKLEGGQLKLLFCHGMDDLMNLVARPTERFKTPALLTTFYNRIEKKQWQQRWPSLQVVTD